MPMPTAISSYAALRRAVEAAVCKGRAEIEKAWVHTYHETGRLIHEHILCHADRAAYGAQAFNRLAADTGIDKRTLQQSVQFYRYFPIARHGAQLSWAHYRALCQVEDEAQRTKLLKEAVAKRLTSPQLIERVRTWNAAEFTAAGAAARDVTPPKLLTPRRGTVGVCKIIAAGAELVVDLGFVTYLDLPEGAGLKAGDFVRVDATGRASVLEGAAKADLFTYAAVILKVVDGDTLWVKIYLRPRQWVKQKLRLRDLDAPELATPEGKAAKRFVDGLLPAGTAVTVCTTKPDKYDRYLADVFVEAKEGEPVYLNNALLAAGHAVVKREWQFGDWGPE